MYGQVPTVSSILCNGKGLNHFAVHQKLTQYKSIILQLKKKKTFNKRNFNSVSQLSSFH